MLKRERKLRKKNVTNLDSVMKNKKLTWIMKTVWNNKVMLKKVQITLAEKIEQPQNSAKLAGSFVYARGWQFSCQIFKKIISVESCPTKLWQLCS